ncbi:hypothetical protein BVD23_11810 [Salmonella enterica]|nr:hypothetical protein [Salmonella enterica]EAN4946405.1 hypothetical protein [Salmonella enterica]EBI7618570.1 hypothetical protein [Salmonella enterica]EBI8100274.1 hypothetical protein [Salmonella enterica]EBK3005461.1 hypothetical protein [Salmonella enterica]
MSLTKGSLWLCKFVPDEFVAHLPPSCNANHLANDLAGCHTAARLLIKENNNDRSHENYAFHAACRCALGRQSHLQH